LITKKVEAHIRKHITIGNDGEAHIEETLVPERNMMPIEKYAQLYAEKMDIELVDGVRIIHPDDFQCYELQNDKWVTITVDD